MRRLAVLIVLLLPLAGAQEPALDPASPSLEFVMRTEPGGALEGTTYHYELHPQGHHEPINGKFYGSSEFALEGFRQFVLTMPYANADEVLLEQGGRVNASFVFGVTNRGEGDYEVTWRLLANDTIAAEGETKSFHLVGQGDDVGFRQVAWQTPTQVDRLPAGASISLEIDIQFSGNAPFIKDRGTVIDLPPRMHDVPVDPVPDTEPTSEQNVSAAPVDTGAVDVPEPAGGVDEQAKDRDLSWVWVPAIILAGLAAIVWIQRRT